MRRLKISNTDEALKFLKDACELETFEGYDLFLSLAYAIRGEYQMMAGNYSRRFDLLPVFRVVYEFFEDWQWYSNFGIEPEDYKEIIEEGMKYLRLIAKTDYSYLGETPKYEEGKYAVHRDLPGYKEWQAKARKHFNEVSHTEKYIKGWDRDFMGL